MAKIKGWKKIGKNRWVVNTPEQPYGASVEIGKNRYGDILLVLPHDTIIMNSKEQAKRFAVDYMRSHPNG